MPGAHHPRRATWKHHDRILRDARSFFLEVRGAAEYARRAQAIAELPIVEWKGATLRTIRCHGTTGKGPHLQHVPEALLWILIDIGAYRCVFHPS